MKMSPPNLLPIFKHLAKTDIKIAGPLLILLLGCQVFLDIKFSCPCKYGWSQAVSFLILVVPFLIGLVIALLFILYREQDNNETSEPQDNTGSPQESNSWTCSTVCACLVPSAMWCCIYFIDGDYLACLGTVWIGRYTCDKELHPNCLNWCKPTELSPGQNETELYEKTCMLINASKVAGYILAGLLCIIAIIVCSLKLKCCECKNTTNPRVSGGGPDQKSSTRSEVQNPTNSKGSGGQHSPTTSTGSGEQQDPTDATVSGDPPDPAVPTKHQGKQDPRGPTKSEAQKDPKDAAKSEGEQDEEDTLRERLLPRTHQEVQIEVYHSADTENSNENNGLQ